MSSDQNVQIEKLSARYRLIVVFYAEKLILKLILLLKVHEANRGLGGNLLLQGIQKSYTHFETNILIIPMYLTIYKELVC